MGNEGISNANKIQALEKKIEQLSIMFRQMAASRTETVVISKKLERKQ
jgi:hypothetical protein